MKKILFVLFVVCLFVAGCATQTQTQTQTQAQTGGQGEETMQGTQEILIKNFSFVPKEISVAKGTTVVWSNRDSVTHDVTSSLFSQDINPGESFSYTFAQAGEYPYHCDIHTYMTGTITVQ